MEEQIKIVLEQQTKILNQQNDFRNQLDSDRTDINDLRIGQSTIKEQMSVLLESINSFKKEIRQQVADTIALEVPKVVKKSIQNEIRLLSKNNPKKRIEGKIGLLEWLKLLFKLNK